MQVSVEVKEGLKRQVKVTVPAEQVESAISKRLAEMTGKVKIKGFRAGKVPKAEVERRYGASVRQEVVGQLLQTTFYDALEKEHLHVVGTPKITPLPSDAGQPLEYIADVEILPEFEPVELEGVDITKPVSSIADIDVDNGVENLRKQHMAWEVVERASQEGDQVTVDYKGIMDGVAFEGGTANDTPIIIGSNRMIPGFEDGLKNLKAGDTSSLDLTFPEQYQEHLAGKAVTFEITVKKVEVPVLPELNDALAEKFGIKDGGIEALRAEVLKNLDRSLDEVIKAQVRRQVIENLLERNDIDTPSTLVDNEITRMQKEVAHKYSRGSKEEAEKILSQMPKENFEKQALMNVKTGLIFGELIKRKKLKVDDELVKAHIQSMSVVYQNPEQVVQWYYSNKEQLAEVERIVLEQQVLDAVLETANVTEKQMSYSELTAEASKQQQ